MPAWSSTVATCALCLFAVTPVLLPKTAAAGAISSAGLLRPLLYDCAPEGPSTANAELLRIRVGMTRDEARWMVETHDTSGQIQVIPATEDSAKGVLTFSALLAESSFKKGCSLDLHVADHTDSNLISSSPATWQVPAALVISCGTNSAPQSLTCRVAYDFL